MRDLVADLRGYGDVDARPAARRVVAIGGSAGSIDALIELFTAIPETAAAAFLVVVHVSRTGPSVLPQIVARAASSPAWHARGGETIREGDIVIAPPDHHLLVQDGVVRLDHGAKEQLNRPAVNPLFRSVADAYGANAIGIVLSGALDDGAAGLAAIKAAGGHALVQAPEEARVPSMPLSALQAVEADDVLGARALGRRVAELLEEHPDAADPRGGFATAEEATERIEREGEQTPFTCPECGGTLWAKAAGDGMVLRCRVGHAYSEESLLHGQADVIENALWSAIRALEERADFLNRVGERLRLRGSTASSDSYARRAADLTEQGQAIRDLLDRQRLALEEAPAT